MIHPSEDGSALVTDDTGCNGGCGTAATDNWNGTWLAIDGASGGVVILRDPGNSVAPTQARLVRDNDGFSAANNSGVSLLRPGGGWHVPLTEIEYLCFYDATTWPVATRSPTNLPPGCVPRTVPINTVLPSITGMPATRNPTTS